MQIVCLRETSDDSSWRVKAQACSNLIEVCFGVRIHQASSRAAEGRGGKAGTVQAFHLSPDPARLIELLLLVAAVLGAGAAVLFSQYTVSLQIAVARPMAIAAGRRAAAVGRRGSRRRLRPTSSDID